jgi:hypothetical protein
LTITHGPVLTTGLSERENEKWIVRAGVRRALRWVWLASALLVAAPRAQAEPGEIILAAELPAPLAGCVTGEQLNDSYRRALAAYGGGEGPSGRVQLQAAVTSRPGAQAGTILLQIAAFNADAALGTRELPVRTDDCAALPDALGLVLALLARDAAPAPPAAPVSAAPASAAASSSLQPSAAEQTAPRPQRPPAPARSPHVALGIAAGAVFGVLPSAALALQLQAATPGDRLSLRLKAGLLWPQEHSLAEGFIQTRSYELALELCGGLQWPGWSRLWLRLCAGPRVGVMHGRGRDFGVQNLSASEPLVHLGLTPELALRLASGTWLQLGAGAALAIMRPRFQVAVDGGRRIVELPHPALLRGELGMSIVQIF